MNTTSLQHLSTAVAQAWKTIERSTARKGELQGVASGFADLDRLTYGFQREDLIVIGGGVSSGKTSLALGLLEAAVLPRKGTPVLTLFISLQMSREKVASRLIHSRARIRAQTIRDGLFRKDGDEPQRLREASEELAKAPCIVDDSKTMNAEDLLRIAEDRKQGKEAFGLVIIDGIQAFGPVGLPNLTDEQRIADTARALKSLARTLEVPVIATSSLTRSPGKDNRRPKLSDLRGSGAIEDSADVVMLISRPDDGGPQDHRHADTSELLVEKNRNGPTGELRLTFLRELCRFESYVD
jgi:replicative DNA helicase